MILKQKLEPALIIIDRKLKETGMSQEEIDFLISRFLQEEARDYVECMKLVEEQTKEEVTLH